MIKNPLFISIDDNLSKIGRKDLEETYPTLYIITLKDSYKQEKNIRLLYNNKINKDTFEYLVNKLAFYKCNIKAIDSNKMNLTLLNKTDIKTLQLDACDNDFVDGQLLVSVMLNIKKLMIPNLLRHKNKSFTVDDLYNWITINKNIYGYFNRNKLLAMMTDIDTSFFLEKDRLDVRYTPIFKKHFFHQKDLLFLKKNSDEKEKNVGKSKDYNFQFKNNESTDDEYIDKNWNKYIPPKHIEIDNVQNKILDIIEMLSYDEYLVVYFISAILTSKNYVHTILNNKVVMERIVPFFKKYQKLFKYILGYSWIILYLEELKKINTIKDHDRILFDISSASLLPYFSNTIDNFLSNPYLPILVSRQQLNYKNNFLGVFCTETNKFIYKQNYHTNICDMETLQKRLNIFICENPDINVFENINWENIGITGSSMAACLPKYNPLFEQVLVKTDEFTSFKVYLDLFYNYTKTDLDVMCHIKTFKEFFEKTDEIINKILNNISTYIDSGIHSKKDKVKISTIRKLEFYVNKNIILDYLKNTIKDSSDLNTIVTTENLAKLLNDHQKYKNFFYAYYLQNKSDNDDFYNFNYLNDISKTADINSINFIIIDDIIPIKNDPNGPIYSYNEHKQLYKNKIAFIMNEKIKFEVKFLKIPRNIEIFNIYKNCDSTLYSALSRFHLAVVKSIYIGNTCKLLPSAISAYMTFTNLNHKIMSTNYNSALDIITKY